MVAAEKSSKDGATLPIYVINGSDDFLKLQALHGLISRILGDDLDHMAFVEFEGRSAQLVEVLDECRALSLLAPTRLVCVKNADEFITAHRPALEKYLASPSSTGVLILVCTRWDTRWKISKLVERIGRSIICNAPKRRHEVVAWATRHAATAHKVKLESDAAHRLVDLVGDQLGVLDTDLAKLATFVAPRSSIGRTDVEDLVGVSRSEKVFAITDALASRDARSALALWEQIVATDRDAPYRAVGGLAYGFRKLAAAKRLVQQGLHVTEAARRANIWDQAGLQRQLDRFSLRQWEDHLVQLLRIDVGAKSGLGGVRSAVEQFIVRLCSAS